jgi:hypothetical protein
MKPSERTTVTIETALYALAFTLALSLRLLNLGAAPLSDFEAAFASQAYKLAQGQAIDVGPQPAYVVLTSIVFALFKDSNSTARLIPAFAGSLLVFLPVLFRSFASISGWMRYAGLILAFGLALDPALVALSRMAGSPILALTFLVLTLGFIGRGNAAGTGISASLALLSGPSLITGLLGLGGAAVIWYFMPAGIIETTHIIALSGEARSKRFWSRSILFAASAFMVVGLVWLALPQGLAGLAQLIPAYVMGWTQASGVPALRLPATLLFYQPLITVFGLAAIGFAWFGGRKQSHPAEGLGRLLSLWALIALLPGLLYPSRQVFDAVWAVIPLWILTAILLSQLVPGRLHPSLRLPALGLAGLTAMFLGLIWYNLLRLGNLQAQPILYAAIIGGLIVMALIVIVLASLAWHPSVAAVGLAWGFTAVAGLTMFAGMWGMSQVRTNQPAELWMVEPGAGQVNELIRTIHQLSQRQTGLYQAIDIVTDIDSPALHWALRRFQNMVFTRSIAYDQQPAIILTEGAHPHPRQSSAYRGQELVWRLKPAWEGAAPPNLLRWLTFRESPTTSQTIILWARSDLFIGDPDLDDGVDDQPNP